MQPLPERVRTKDLMAAFGCTPWEVRQMEQCGVLHRLRDYAGHRGYFARDEVARQLGGNGHAKPSKGHNGKKRRC